MNGRQLLCPKQRLEICNVSGSGHYRGSRFERQLPVFLP